MEPDVGMMLRDVNAGDAKAFDSLVALVYGQLRGMAGSMMRGQDAGHTPQPTALVNEAYLRLVQGNTPAPARATGGYL